MSPLRGKMSDDGMLPSRSINYLYFLETSSLLSSQSRLHSAAASPKETGSSSSPSVSHLQFS